MSFDFGTISGGEEAAHDESMASLASIQNGVGDGAGDRAVSGGGRSGSGSVSRSGSRSKRRYLWASKSPGARERTSMLTKCGRKCFLGPGKSFPICARKTRKCQINMNGVRAAYTRAREMMSRKDRRYSVKTYSKIASKAKRIIRK
jgi:hypothetical protein